MLTSFGISCRNLSIYLPRNFWMAFRLNCSFLLPFKQLNLGRVAVGSKNTKTNSCSVIYKKPHTYLLLVLIPFHFNSSLLSYFFRRRKIKKQYISHTFSNTYLKQWCSLPSVFFLFYIFVLFTCQYKTNSWFFTVIQYENISWFMFLAKIST